MTSTIINELRQRRYKGMKHALYHGSTPDVPFTNKFSGGRGKSIFLTTAGGVFVVYTIILLGFSHRHFWSALHHGLLMGLWVGLAVTVLYYLCPLWYVFGFTLWYRQRPPRKSMRYFSTGQKIVCLATLAFALFYLINHLSPDIWHAWRTNHWPHHWLRHHTYISGGWRITAIVMGLTIVLACIVPFLLPSEKKPRHRRVRHTDRFGVWLGQSTGRLATLSHQTGMAPNRNIVLSRADAAQNILVLGGIGAGKTTRLMQPLLAQLLDQACGGLLFDVKGDVQAAVKQLASMTNRQISVIGPTHTPMNLLAGLTPEVAASFLKSAFLLSGGVKLDAFWIDTATELCRNTLGILSFLPAHYTLDGLYSYLFDLAAREAIQTALTPLLETLEAKPKRLLKAYLRYHQAIFSTFDEKIKSGVNATVAQALSPFTHPELIDAFCAHSHEDLSMPAVLEGTVYLVDMPLARWGLGGKVAYTFIKLRFFNLMQNRVHQPNWNQERPVFFMCDEYQELISANKEGLSDLNFWDKSRSSHTIGIISAQSVSSVYAALGDRDLAHAILQNFRQKVCFRTEDEATLRMMDRLAGQARVQRKTVSQTTGDADFALMDPRSSHHSNTQSITEVRESVLDATLFRYLSPNQAVVLLSLYGHSMDDVVELLPVFL